MEEFPYYHLSWFIYLILSMLFLLLSARTTRKWPIWLRIPLLSFIAAMALTPGITISGESWWSPAAIIMIFALDKNGLSGIWGSLLSILAFWLIFMVSASLMSWRINKRNKNSNKVDNKIHQQSKIQPELIEPE